MTDATPLANDTDKDIAFLLEAARYFEKRPTNGEDAAHWSNVANAASCRRIAASLASTTIGARHD